MSDDAPPPLPADDPGEPAQVRPESPPDLVQQVAADPVEGTLALTRSISVDPLKLAGGSRVDEMVRKLTQVGLGTRSAVDAALASSRTLAVIHDVSGQARLHALASNYGVLGPSAGSLGMLRQSERERLTAWAKPLGGVDMANWARLAGSQLASVERAQHWSTAIGGRSAAELTKVLDGSARFADELAAIRRSASAAVSASVAARNALDGILRHHKALEGTVLKLSTFAAGTEMFGAQAAVSQSAFRALLGDWQTRTDLPAAFWRDDALRHARYHDAGVDRGLVETDHSTLLEVLIETGVVASASGGRTVTALIEAGPVQVTITATRARLGAYRAISAFEVALRSYVASKIEAGVREAGEDPQGWFKRRMPGDVLKRVRERREAAKRAGEPPASMISFVDLGDFITIITSGRNWPLFEPAFECRDSFRVDMLRLNAIRRPAAHPRRVDPVQLAEAILTIHRLNSMMARDGGWDPAWDDEDG